MTAYLLKDQSGHTLGDYLALTEAEAARGQRIEDLATKLERWEQIPRDEAIEEARRDFFIEFVDD